MGDTARHLNYFQPLTQGTEVVIVDGGGQSGGSGLTNTELRASPLEVVSPTVSTTFSFTANNQTTSELVTSSDINTLSIQVDGTFFATITVQGTINGTTWLSLNNTNSIINIVSKARSATITSAGLYMVDISGLSRVRLTTTTYSSGTANVTLHASSSISEETVVITNSTLATTVSSGVLNIQPSATHGFTPVSTLLSNSINATVVKASAGVIGSIIVSNDTATKFFLKIYNKSTAPVPASDTPLMRVLIPPNDTITLPPVFTGTRFSSGISFITTGLIGDTDTTAVAANAGVVNIAFI